MAINVRDVDRGQLWLMPPSISDWLPDGHLVWFVLDVVAELDLSAFTAELRADGRGGAVYDPAMMLGVFALCVLRGGTLESLDRAALRGRRCVSGVGREPVA